MDKAKITDIVNQASLDIKTLFPAWYENREVPQTIITNQKDVWQRYVDRKKNELRIGVITNVTLIEELTVRVAKAYKLYKDSKDHELVTNIWSDKPHHFIEFMILCDIIICQNFLDFLNSTHPTPKPAQEAITKQWALFYWFLMEANVMPEIRGAKKSIKELGQKHNLGEDNFYQTFNAVNRGKAKDPMKPYILKKVIPMLEPYPEARAKAELELKKHTKE